MEYNNFIPGKFFCYHHDLCFGWSFFCFGSIETPKLAVSVKKRNNRNKHFVSDSAKTCFSSIFGCFESKLVSLDTLGPCMQHLSWKVGVVRWPAMATIGCNIPMTLYIYFNIHNKQVNSVLAYGLCIRRVYAIRACAYRNFFKLLSHRKWFCKCNPLPTSEQIFGFGSKIVFVTNRRYACPCKNSTSIN